MSANITMKLDKWQKEVVTSKSARIIVAGARQVGKSTVLREKARLAMKIPRTTVFWFGMSRIVRNTKDLIPNRLENGSRSVQYHQGMARGEHTICLFEEAEYIDRTMLDAAISLIPEQIVLVGTPRIHDMKTYVEGSDILFEEWVSNDHDWHRWHIPYTVCPRITEKHIAQIKRYVEEPMFRSEWKAEFVSNPQQQRDE